jgi:hypothetical protein
LRIEATKVVGVGHAMLLAAPLNSRLNSALNSSPEQKRDQPPHRSNTPDPDRATQRATFGSEICS